MKGVIIPDITHEEADALINEDTVVLLDGGISTRTPMHILCNIMNEEHRVKVGPHERCRLGERGARCGV